MLVVAGWDAICEECGSRIAPGSPATWKVEHGCYRHVSCNDAHRRRELIPHPGDRLATMVQGAREALVRYRALRYREVFTRLLDVMSLVRGITNPQEMEEDSPQPHNSGGARDKFHPRTRVDRVWYEGRAMFAREALATLGMMADGDTQDDNGEGGE
jgi:hypothetical protein